MPARLDPHRTHLLHALRADLIGPYDPESGQEVLHKPPMRWYLTGFVVPERGATAPPSGHEASEGNEAGDETAGEDTPEPAAKQPPILPSAIGMSVLLPPAAGEQDDAITVRLRWGEYAAHTTNEEVERLCVARGLDPQAHLGVGKTPKTLWSRVIREATVSLPLHGLAAGALHEVRVPQAGGVTVEYRLESLSAEVAQTLRIGTPGQGARALSVFVVNGRSVQTSWDDDAAGYARELNERSLFQLEFELLAPGELLSRPDAHFASSRDHDDQMVDLQFRDEVEWGVGHGIATAPLGRERSEPVHPRQNPAVGVRAQWLPHTRVARVRQPEIPGITVSMRVLSNVQTADDIEAALGPLPTAYAQWIEGQAAVELSAQNHRETQTRLVSDARHALARIEAGIARLREDPPLRQAFAWANEAMAEVATRRIGKGDPNFEPKWRLFQLAFLVLNLCSIDDPEHEERRTVELLFFPTGGGKTEAYLGVIATTLLLRRMKGQARPDGGLGVAVLLRYTLRLLTLDQLERSAALVCSLELIRRRAPDRLGTQRFAVGLWVGKSASPNRLADVRKKIVEFRAQSSTTGAGSPFPLVHCPWCGEKLVASKMDTRPRGKAKPTGTVVVCANQACEFSGMRRGQEGTKVGELPVLFVDEQIYAELPAFIVATVDKFALLTHAGPAGKLFGRVHSYTDKATEPRRFWGGGDGDDYTTVARGAEPLPRGLPPPELIVQDELHLISGPLGTMVGLFETMVEHLCDRPKIIAATATVRRASAQVSALYGRTDPGQTRLFPPQGVDAWQTFFAERDTAANERMYLGVAAAGRSMKRSLLSSYLALLGAAEYLAATPEHGPAVADPYKTLVGYFNSLRELGGMRRLVDDEITRRAQKLDDRIPLDHRAPGAHHRWLRSRSLGDPVELTSRVPTTRLSETKARLAVPFHQEHDLHPLDVALSSNMIAVGVDVDRLGTMVVAGQPKTTAEYIQASSRVGRDDARPGFVVTVYNLHKPRDRSHFEHFIAYHESFYRYVEATSVTPFSLPALDRALGSLVVGMVRHSGSPTLAAPRGAKEHVLIGDQRDSVVDAICTRAAAQPSDVSPEFLRQRCGGIISAWKTIIMPTVDSQGSAAAYCYSPYEERRAGAKALLRTPEDDAKRDPTQQIQPSDDRYAFVAPTSMRDVEPSVAIWVRRRPTLG